MKDRSTIVLVAVAAVVGFAGGLLGSLVMPQSLPENATFKEVTAEKVSATQLVAVAEDAKLNCTLSAGNLVSPQGVITGQVRANAVFTKSVLATTNPTEANIANQKIMAELAAQPEYGGILNLRNRDGMLQPSQGAVNQGQRVCIEFEKKGGQPAMYIHDMSRGAEGISFLVKPQTQVAANPAAPKAPEAPAGTTPKTGPPTGVTNPPSYPEPRTTTQTAPNLTQPRTATSPTTPPAPGYGAMR